MIFYFSLVILSWTKDRTGHKDKRKEQLVLPSKSFAFGVKKRQKSSKRKAVTEPEKIEGIIENGP